MYESFIKWSVCVWRGERGVGLHLSLDYLRKLFFFFFLVSNWCSDFKSIIAVQPNIMTSVKFSEQPWLVSDTGFFFFFLKFIKTWICVCSVLTWCVRVSSHKNYLGLCMTVQYNLNCRMIMLPHFPTLCFSVELLTLISFALQVLLFRCWDWIVLL